jgi:hypothetical protein
MTFFSAASYLAAKRTIDDRALNQHVLRVLQRELLQAAPVPTVLDLGAGTGAMVDRLAEWGVLTRAQYLLLDGDRALLDEAIARLTAWAVASGRTVAVVGECLHICGGAPAVDLRLQCVCAELSTFLGGATQPVDVLIANAFLDLVDVPATLPALLAQIKPSGLYWFSINFDGETIFVPEHAGDAELIGAYHRSMDERMRRGLRAGHSRTGRQLFANLRAAGATILASGSSDWVVHAIAGAYPAEERAFLDDILATIEAEVKGRADVDAACLGEWLRVRRDQLARAELVYIAHQLDFVGRRAPA